MTKKNKQKIKKSLTIRGYEIIISRRLVFHIIMTIGVLVAIGMFFHTSNTTKTKLQQAQALQVFLRIDDYAHQGIAELRPRRTMISGSIETFTEIDTKFHAAKTLKARYERAKEMDILLNILDQKIHIQDTSKIQDFDQRDKKFHEIDSIFHQLVDNSTLRDIQEAKSIEVFNKIYNISLQKYKEISIKKNPNTAGIDEEFPKMQKEYQKATTLHQKYKIVKKFVELMKKGHDIVKNLGYSTPQDDQEFYELINEFNHTKAW